MALTSCIRQNSLIINHLQHKRITVVANGTSVLLTGITDKRIRIWRMHAYCGSKASNTCTFMSGANALHPVVQLAEKFDWIEHAVDNEPVFICNDGENFIVSISQFSTWQFYFVYSIE